ncbi:MULTISPECIES: hypothetical protein [Nocardia]|uniref:hypothetical protein n=1 Tax=Nocardia TaxID=1817 RepID=UPI00055B82C3|nr:MULTISPECIES: hypothetical protein [Nocardia]
MSDLATLQQLGAQVEQGNLRLKVHRSQLEAAIKGLQDLIDQINDLSLHVETVAQVTGFGGFQMGLDLAEKFTRKGSGEGSIRQRIKEAIDELKSAQDVIRKAAEAYAETDDAYRKEYEGFQF